MKNSVKNTIFLSILLIFSVNIGHAFDLDETVDDEIRKNYNDTKLINDSGIKNTALNKSTKSKEVMQDEDLPELPSITKHASSTKQPDVITSDSATPPKINIPYHGGNIRVKKGTSFLVSNSNQISDWQSKGTAVKFATKSSIKSAYYTLPAGTVFKGEVVESHQPQITCNGGLVSVRIYSMIYKNQTVPVNAYVIRANDKKIFFNDIKGARTYIKTMWKKGGWGRSIFNQMITLTVKLGSEGSTLLLSPFPAAYGVICLGFNAITSPITAFFSKGGHVSIPAGSNFKIKLLEDAYID